MPRLILEADVGTYVHGRLILDADVGSTIRRGVVHLSSALAKLEPRR